MAINSRQKTSLLLLIIFLLIIPIALILVQARAIFSGRAAFKTLHASGEILFSDNFNLAGCANNVASLPNWSIINPATGGSSEIDVVGRNSPTGGCAPLLYDFSYLYQIDMEGSYAHPAELRMINPVSAVPGIYNVSLWTATRNPQPNFNTLKLQVVGNSTTLLSKLYGPLGPSQPPTLRSEDFEVPTPDSLKIVMGDVQDYGSNWSDNYGVVIDDVKLVFVHGYAAQAIIQATPNPVPGPNQPVAFHIVIKDQWGNEFVPPPGTTVNWVFGDGQSCMGCALDATHTFAAVGSYTISATVGTIPGVIGYLTLQVGINPTSTPSPTSPPIPSPTKEPTPTCAPPPPCLYFTRPCKMPDPGNWCPVTPTIKPTDTPQKSFKTPPTF